MSRRATVPTHQPLSGRAPAAPVRCPAVVEALPERTMLSAAPVAPAVADRLVREGFTPVRWHGHAVYAEPGQWILSAKGFSGPAPMQEHLAAAKLAHLGNGLHVVKQLGTDGLFKISAPRTMTAAQLRSVLGRMHSFRSVEPDGAVWTEGQFAQRDDPYYGQQYALNNTGANGGVAGADIDAPAAWTAAGGSAQEVVVAEIDTGVDYTHPDLADDIWTNPFEIPGDGIDNDHNGFVDDVHGADFVYQDGDPMDENGHGTHVAGIIAAEGNNGIGTSGVAPNAKVMPLRMFDATGFGAVDSAVSALNYAMDMKSRGVNVRVANASWGGGDLSDALDQAIRAAGDAGILFVAAAGNGGDDQVGDNNDLTPFYPASYDDPNILSVAASDNKDALGRLSNYGPKTVDLAAPGLLIISTWLNDSYQYLSGTSMATPHVSGVAALAFGLHPDATWQMVRSALLQGSDKIASMDGKTVSGGRLNALGTLLAMSPPATVAGRHVFYNNSVFDGRNVAAGPEDDAAVAPDKAALLRGDIATFANYTSYGKGVNGVMADLAGDGNSAALTAADFAFAVRMQSGDWAAAPAPSSVTVRPGAGDDGSDRVSITWADGSIKDTWLRVTVLATAATRLAQPDVFYFGNLAGETGNSTSDAVVNASDFAATRAAQRTGVVPIDSAFDFNRDGSVNALDTSVVRGRQSVPALPLITAPDGTAGAAPLFSTTAIAPDALQVQRVADLVEP